MTPSDLRALRARLGLSQWQLAEAIGLTVYTRRDGVKVNRQIMRYEADVGSRNHAPIPEPVAKLLELLFPAIP